MALPVQLKSYKPLSGRFVPLQWEEEVQPQKKEQFRSTGTKNMFCHSRTSLIATKTLAVGLKLLPEYKFRSAKNEHVDRTNLNIIHQFLQPDTLSLSLCLSPASRTSGAKKIRTAG